MSGPAAETLNRPEATGGGTAPQPDNPQAGRAREFAGRLKGWFSGENAGQVLHKLGEQKREVAAGLGEKREKFRTKRAETRARKEANNVAQEVNEDGAILKKSEIKDYSKWKDATKKRLGARRFSQDASDYYDKHKDEVNSHYDKLLSDRRSESPDYNPSSKDILRLRAQAIQDVRRAEQAGRVGAGVELKRTLRDIQNDPDYEAKVAVALDKATMTKKGELTRSERARERRKVLKTEYQKDHPLRATLDAQRRAQEAQDRQPAGTEGGRNVPEIPRAIPVTPEFSGTTDGGRTETSGTEDRAAAERAAAEQEAADKRRKDLAKPGVQKLLEPALISLSQTDEDISEEAVRAAEDTAIETYTKDLRAEAMKGPFQRKLMEMRRDPANAGRPFSEVQAEALTAAINSVEQTQEAEARAATAAPASEAQATTATSGETAAPPDGPPLTAAEAAVSTEQAAENAKRTPTEVLKEAGIDMTDPRIQELLDQLDSPNVTDVDQEAFVDRMQNALSAAQEMIPQIMKGLGITDESEAAEIAKRFMLGQLTDQLGPDDEEGDGTGRDARLIWRILYGILSAAGYAAELVLASGAAAAGEVGNAVG